jgi:hypothetical protein
MSWLIGRVLFADRPHDRSVGNHPSRTTVAGRLRRSTRELGRAALKRSRTGSPKTLGFLTLLRVGFTEPLRSPGALVVSYTTVSPLPPTAGCPTAGGGLFSVALSRGLPRVGVTHHHALWSPDLPRRTPRKERGAVARPAHPQTSA